MEIFALESSFTVLLLFQSNILPHKEHKVTIEINRIEILQCSLAPFVVFSIKIFYHIRNIR